MIIDVSHHVITFCANTLLLSQCVHTLLSYLTFVDFVIEAGGLWDVSSTPPNFASIFKFMYFLLLSIFPNSLSMYNQL